MPSQFDEIYDQILNSNNIVDAPNIAPIPVVEPIESTLSYPFLFKYITDNNQIKSIIVCGIGLDEVSGRKDAGDKFLVLYRTLRKEKSTS